MAFVNPFVATNTRSYICGGPYKLVQTPSGALYAFDIGNRGDGSTSVYCNYYKSTDYGRTWSGAAIDTETTHAAVSVWYDRWSGISGDLIHITFTDTTSDDVFYRSLDTSTDTLGTERLVFTGATGLALSNNNQGITVARGGNIYIAYDIDGGTETGFYRSTDGGATWSSRSSPIEGASDQWILVPGFATDNQDIMCLFWDVSADEVSKKIYDDSTNTWSEVSLSTGMVDISMATLYSNISAAVDLDGSKIIFAAWNGVDVANADLKAWSFDETTTNALTDIVLDGTDDQGCVALSVYGSAIYAHYMGRSTGTDIYTGAWSLCQKISTDGGTTWSSEKVVHGPMDIRSIYAPPLAYTEPSCLEIHYATQNQCPMSYVVNELSPGVNGQIGMN